MIFSWFLKSDQIQFLVLQTMKFAIGKFHNTQNDNQEQKQKTKEQSQEQPKQEQQTGKLSIQSE